jgi:hypothetical protein
MIAPLITIRPGPVLHVWRNGIATEQVALSEDQIIYMLCKLCEALSRKDRDSMPPGTLEHSTPKGEPA